MLKMYRRDFYVQFLKAVDCIYLYALSTRKEKPERQPSLLLVFSYPRSTTNFSTLGKLYRSKSAVFSKLLLTLCLFGILASAKALAKVDLKESGVPRSVASVFFLQQILQGKVVDEQGNLIKGATIRLKTDATKAATTNDEGLFSIAIPTSEATLVVSYLGYESQEVVLAPNHKGPIEVRLKTIDNEVEEVVVVGYGQQKKTLVTGSVVQIKGEELKKAPVANVTNALVGRLPGLRATQRSGQPGADGSGIDIRGFGAVLVIVDGVPGSFSQLDPSEIESLSIIKDASASVYGVRAANGVVLVTTKRGSNGKSTINYSTYYGLQTINSFPELGDAALFAELSNESVLNNWVIGGRQSALKLPFTQEQVEQYRTGALPSYNWFDKAIRRTSGQYYQNLNASGGTEDIKYFMNIGLLNQDGMWKSDATNFKRYNVRANVEAKVAEGLTATLNLMGRREAVNNPSTATPLLMAGLYRTYPTYSFYANDNPDYLGIPNNAAQNTLALMDTDLTGYDKRLKSVFNGIFSLKYDIPRVRGLSAKALYSFNYEVVNQKSYSKRYDLYRYDADKDRYEVDFSDNMPSNLEVVNSNTENRTFQLSLSYARKFANKHNVGALFLFESQEGIGNNLSAYRQFLLDGVDELFAGMGTNQRNNGSSYETARLGYVGKINYDFSDKYLAELAFRYDGTYKVKSGARYGFFPNVSVGWVLSRENFLKDVGFLNLLKLRASHGKVGDDEQIAAFQYLVGYTYPTANWVFGESPVPGLVDRGLANGDLTWYTSKTTNIGLDFSLWNGLLSGEIDVFYRKRTGLLASRLLSLPNTFGASLPQENLNTDNNRGFEIALSHRSHVGKFQYSISPNMSWARRQYGFVERAESTNALHNWRNNYTNRWDNLYWGYKAIGQFQNQTEINTAAIHDDQGNKTLLPGDIKYADLNGDGIIDDKDQTIIGRGMTPEIFYGLNISASYSGFDLSVLLQGATNFNAYFSEELQNPLFNNASAYQMFGDRWHHTDPTDADSPWVAGKYPTTVNSGSNNNKRVSDFWLRDASYLRLKTFELGYSFDKERLRRVKIRNLRVYAAGQNILTIDKIKYIDPEAPSGRGNYYPQQRVWTLGLNIGF
ncbi:SusC/RagA family TonB-linked outer membrane protein [Sphingobacterium sp. MYb382]|uniref:SusC/RagA family TonB-linked outer membrane protein n=1 Tax=Sphingobacterium sp. MYb382 TaxID=2745278 RepID=UPI0030B3B272